MKKFICLLSILLLIFTLVPASTFAATNPQSPVEDVVNSESAEPSESNAQQEGDRTGNDSQGLPQTNGFEVNNNKMSTSKASINDTGISNSDYNFEENINIEDHEFRLDQTTFWYDGKQHIPKVICNTLEEGKDYSVDYYNMNYMEDYSSPGVYTAHIYGSGAYTYGEVELTYRIIKTTITLNASKPVLYRRGTLQLKCAVSHPKGKTTFTSSNNKVASVTAGGKIFAKTAGTAKITVRNGNASKVVTVTVKNPYINLKQAYLRVGEYKMLKLTGRIGTATFKSTNPKAATVNKYGKIVAKAKGRTTIVVISNGISMKCIVTVNPPRMSQGTLKLWNTTRVKLSVLGGVGAIKWKSSNSKVASVTPGGLVLGKKSGRCTISATRGKYTVKCIVTVPRTYYNYSVPDFGAAYGINAISIQDDNDGHTRVYKGNKSYYNKYVSLIKRSGFKKLTSDKNITVYVNGKYDIVAPYYKNGRIAIVYSNLWEFDEDEDTSDTEDYNYDDTDDSYTDYDYSDSNEDYYTDDNDTYSYDDDSLYTDYSNY